MTMELITHYDLDGASCAILLNSFIKNLNVKAIGYQGLKDTLQKYLKNFDSFIITDLSLDEEMVNQIVESKKKVLWIEHHETSLPFKDYSSNNFNLKTYINEKYCATANVIKFFTRQKFSEELKTLAYLTNDYDTWKLKEEDSRVLNYIFWERKFQAFTKMFERGYDKRLVESFRPGYQRKQEEIYKYLDSCERHDVIEGNKRFLMIFAEQHISDVTLAYPYFHFWFIVSNKNKMSVRCDPRFDLSQAFKKLRDDDRIESAGCHKNAGGITIKPSKFKNDDKAIEYFLEIISIVMESNND